VTGISKSEAKEIAKRYCEQQGWPWREPVSVRWGLLTYTVWSGGRKGGNLLLIPGFRGHITDYGSLRNFDGRPPFRGRRRRPTVLSKRSRNEALPSGRPVRPCPRKSRNSSSRTALSKNALQSAIISIVEERLLPPVAALRDMMGQTGDDQPCQSCHVQDLRNLSHLVNTGIVSPDSRVSR